MAGENDQIQSNPSTTDTDFPSLWERHGTLLEWLIVAFALVLRALWLGMKPPHFDEGVNGWFVDQMTHLGYYQYDPGNYHGPFHFYVLFFMQTLFGRSIEALRLPLVLINTATVWLVLQFRRFIPWRTCIFAALAFAVSPGMLFYSRYAIHEAWLVFGMVLAVWGGAEMWMRGTARGLWATAMGATLMVLNKETHIIHFTAFGLAVATLAALERFLPSSSASKVPARPGAQRWDSNMLGSSLAVSLLLLVFFYSGGFLDPAPGYQKALNFFKAFAVWCNTGVHGGESGPDHTKAWYYWILLVIHYEWPILLGLLWSVRAIWRGMDRLTRYLAIYGCGTLVAYSIVDYKTPWCIISIIWPFFFLFGSGVDSAMRFFERKGTTRGMMLRTAATLAGLVVLGASLATSVNLNFIHPTDPDEWRLASQNPATFLNTRGLTNWIAKVNQDAEEAELLSDGLASKYPKWERKLARWLNSVSLPSYVYVQTTNDYFNLTRPLKALIAMDPSARDLLGNILLSSYHPLPWVLGDFTRIGYYDKESPSTMDADFIIAEKDSSAEKDRSQKVEVELKESYYVFPFKLRDAMNDGKLYLNVKRFGPVFGNLPPDFHPKENPTP